MGCGRPRGRRGRRCPARPRPRSSARARRAVEAAEIADAADQDSWEQSPERRMSAAPDAICRLLRTPSTGSGRRSASSSSGPAAEGSSTGPGSPSPTRSPVPCSPSPMPASCAPAAPATRPACRRGAAVCTHDMTGLPGLGHRGRARVSPGDRSIGSSALASADVASPAAATGCPEGASWTITSPGPRARPRPATSPASARTITAGSTRPPAGTTTCRPTESSRSRTPSGLTASTAPAPY